MKAARDSRIALPELSLVLLIGASGSGKSTFARKHFKPTEIVSSDFCRALVADDENDQSANPAAFDLLRQIADKRLEAGRLTVIDATNVQREARLPLLELARQRHTLAVAIVLNLPERTCQERNRIRTDRQIPPGAIHRQVDQLRRSLRTLQREGFQYIYILKSVEEVDEASVVRERLWTDRRDDHGPFDIIGDVHGCLDELVELLSALGYTVSTAGEDGAVGDPVRHPEGRRLIFLGDLADRGPNPPAVLRLVMNAVRAGGALCVPGNHDMKLVRALRGRNVQLTHGLRETLEQLATQSEAFRLDVAAFLDGLVSHFVFDEGRLVVAHAGMTAEMQGRASRAVRDFALYGETTGEIDEFGLPVRLNWAERYRGSALVVYGHTPVLEPDWVNNTINIDTGCVFGGRLTALRYPERELISVPARRVYYEPARPVGTAPGMGVGRAAEQLLEIQDVLGKRVVQTRLAGRVVISEEQAQAALEVMSRFAVDPRWLMYLPPTMSPCETSARPDFLEHPDEAFSYYAGEGVRSVVCQEKHMGSRAVVILCRDQAAAARRFGVDRGAGACYTRTGRPFFADGALEDQVLNRVRAAFDHAGVWDELETDWVCLDAEIMPWSFKALDLLREQYAAVAAAGRSATAEALRLLTDRPGVESRAALASRYQRRADAIERYAAAYRHYCWPVESLDDLRVAPFHIIASEGGVHVDKSHFWHLELLTRLTAGEASNGGGRVLMPTPFEVVDLEDEQRRAAAAAWWEELTENGGEGIVVKPLDFVVVNGLRLVQPGLKVRGREYLRITYGPEYTHPENLERLRSRKVASKRSLARREFALGIEAAERFVRQEPLYRVHECVFGILALESEPVDPRL